AAAQGPRLRRLLHPGAQPAGGRARHRRRPAPARHRRWRHGGGDDFGPAPEALQGQPERLERPAPRLLRPPRDRPADGEERYPGGYADSGLSAQAGGGAVTEEGTKAQRQEGAGGWTRRLTRVGVCVAAGAMLTMLTAAASLLYAPTTLKGRGVFSSRSVEGQAPGSVHFKPGQVYQGVG